MTITLPAGLMAETGTLSGWGRTNAISFHMVQPSSLSARLTRLSHGSLEAMESVLKPVPGLATVVLALS